MVAKNQNPCYSDFKGKYDTKTVYVTSWYTPK